MVVKQMVILSSALCSSLIAVTMGFFNHLLKFNQPEEMMTLLKVIIDNINTLLCPPLSRSHKPVFNIKYVMLIYCTLLT